MEIFNASIHTQMSFYKDVCIEVKEKSFSEVEFVLSRITSEAEGILELTENFLKQKGWKFGEKLKAKDQDYPVLSGVIAIFKEVRDSIESLDICRDNFRFILFMEGGLLRAYFRIENLNTTSDTEGGIENPEQFLKLEASTIEKIDFEDSNRIETIDQVISKKKESEREFLLMIQFYLMLKKKKNIKTIEFTPDFKEIFIGPNDDDLSENKEVEVSYCR